jgi:hypothetical protein
MAGEERNVEQKRWARALRPIPVLAALGAALAGCGGDARPARYGGSYYGGPGYYGSPYYGGYDYGPSGGYNRYYGPRGHYGGGGYPGRLSQPRTENWTQERLRQHWIERSRQPR